MAHERPVTLQRFGQPDKEILYIGELPAKGDYLTLFEKPKPDGILVETTYEVLRRNFDSFGRVSLRLERVPI